MLTISQNIASRGASQLTNALISADGIDFTHSEFHPKIKINNIPFYSGFPTRTKNWLLDYGEPTSELAEYHKELYELERDYLPFVASYEEWCIFTDILATFLGEDIHGGIYLPANPDQSILAITNYRLDVLDFVWGVPTWVCPDGEMLNSDTLYTYNLGITPNNSTVLDLYNQVTSPYLPNSLVITHTFSRGSNRLVEDYLTSPVAPLDDAGRIQRLFLDIWRVPNLSAYPM